MKRNPMILLLSLLLAITTACSKSDKAENNKKKDLDASRERLRAAYRSGDPAAIKAARENYQKVRSEAKERSGSAPHTR